MVDRGEADRSGRLIAVVAERTELGVDLVESRADGLD